MTCYVYSLIFFRCFHEHLDLFTEVKNPKSAALIDTPFGGRYCGKIPPKQRISLYRVISIVFLSDRDNVTSSRFSGTFSFIPASELDNIELLPFIQYFTTLFHNNWRHFQLLFYSPLISGTYILGTPSPGPDNSKDNICSFTIYSKNREQGEIMTPTYPGTYPKDLECSYKFIGKPNERLRLEFRDFDLFYGGAQ